MKAVVLFSGGQDSTTILLQAVRKYGSDKILALAAFYGQTHSIELRQAKKIAGKLGVKFRMLNLSYIFDNSSLIESGRTHDGEHPYFPGLPINFVPGRNMVLISLAISIAASIGVNEVICGACMMDNAGYPDCRPEFMLKMQEAGTLAADKEVRISTPLMYLSKAETWDLAYQMGEELYEIVRLDSHTCYNGNREILHDWGYGCGECPSCKLRKDGYQEWLTKIREA